MDVLLSVAGTILLQNYQGLRVSCRNGINADGYVPEGSGAARRNTGQQWAEHQKQRPSQHPTASDVDSLALLIGKVGIQIAGMALVSYMSARMFQYAVRGSDRMLQESAKDSLKCKLPHRSDIDIDKLSLDSHEIMVSMVRKRERYNESYLSAAAFRTVSIILYVEALCCCERLCYGLVPSSVTHGRRCTPKGPYQIASSQEEMSSKICFWLDQVVKCSS